MARCFFYIRDSYAFWQSYLELTGVEFAVFVYEELAADPIPFVSHLAEHLQVPLPAELQTSMAVQRDDLTEEWIARFHEDRRSANLLEAYDRREHIPGKLKNFVKLGTRSLRPRYPFAF
ncbi:Stf0 sulfotransferase [Sinorhizobium meliloti]|nr:Stf0 sulfotransferase [Sinorhizobium meliloti]MDW9459917.1 Stf0 sulfotransferase [Sinorhizobium meliloti]MDW9655961.1 Stf0 sulfotransferase [Sinorhizobium meliloti]MDW9915769.1 Stf0 sulfotransferase [Sinorhizobium meliloti]MDW9940879.1 Stf0 sulfotransferase [Sinorhizobium meliloti]